MRVQIGIERHTDVAQEWASFFCDTNLPVAQLYQSVLFQWTQGLQLRSEFFSKINAELIAALRRGVALIQRLGAASGDFAAGVSELDLSRDDRVLVRTVAGGPLLLLDPQRVERNVRDYLSLSEEIERRSGPLDYVDLRWANRISVMPILSNPGTPGPSGNR